MKLREDSIFVLAVTVLLILAVFAILAFEQDKLNARIRALEIHDGFGDKWADHQGKDLP